MKKLSRIIAMLLIILMLATLSVSCKKAEDGEDASLDISQGGSKDDSTTEDAGNGNDDGNSSTDGGNQGAASGGPGTTQQQQSAAQKQEAIDKAEQKGEGAGSYKEDETGKVIETGNHEVDDDYRIQGAVTNDNGFIPDDEQGLSKSDRFATEQSKYNFDQNPLINRDRQVNRTYLPSFDIDGTAFVRAGTKLTDLKGHTLQFFTSDNFAVWSYRNAKGETIDEWTWYKQLKDELGLNIKYTVKQHNASTEAVLQYMNAGKQCDIVYSNHVIWPSSICLTRSITDFVNINNLGSSPGICKTTMDACRWGNTLRLIAPIGLVDVLWYNQTLTQELNLSDPHVMWEKGVWNWDTFRSYMLSAPKKNKNGDNLTALVQWRNNASYCWPATNGAPSVYIDATAKAPTLINNWENPLTLEAWEFITSVANAVNYGYSSTEHLDLYQGKTLMSATMYTQVYRDTEYSKNVQINWVPFPKSTNEKTGRETCQYYGFGMMLPKKTIKEENINAALKFMELWATRFTETLFDNLNTFEYYNFNYKQRKQYFDFVTQNVVFDLAMNNYSGCAMKTETKFFDCFHGDPAYNVKTEAQKAANLVANYVVDCLAYGQ